MRRPVTSTEVALLWGIAGAVAGLSSTGRPEDVFSLGVVAGVIGGAVVAGWCTGVVLPKLRRSPAASAVCRLVRALALATGGAVAGALAGSLAPVGPPDGPNWTGAAGCAGAITGVALGRAPGGLATRRRASAGEAGWPLSWPLLGAIVAAVGGALLLARSGPGAGDVGAVFGAAVGGCFGLARPRHAAASPAVWAVAGAGLGAAAVAALGLHATVARVAAGTLAGAISGELWSEP